MNNVNSGLAGVLEPASTRMRRPGSSGGDLASVPALDLWTQPEAWPAGAEIKHWARHVRVAALVLTHRIALGEPEDPGDVVSIDEVFEEHSTRHISSLHLAADMSYGR